MIFFSWFLSQNIWLFFVSCYFLINLLLWWSPIYKSITCNGITAFDEPAEVHRSWHGFYADKAKNKYNHRTQVTERILFCLFLEIFRNCRSARFLECLFLFWNVHSNLTGLFWIIFILRQYAHEWFVILQSCCVEEFLQCEQRKGKWSCDLWYFWNYFKIFKKKWCFLFEIFCK